MIGVEADGPEAVRRAVATEIERGAEIIKLFPTGGVLGTGAHGYALVMSGEEVAAATAEAHRLGVLAGAHVHGPEGIEVALEAGVDTIEHATAITTVQAERAAAAGVALVPTLTAIDVILAQGDALPPDLRDRATHVRQEQADGIARAIAVGARVLAGTDAGTPFNPPGELVREMKALAGLGLGNLGALAAATSLTAETLRMTGFGLVEPGKRADLLVVDGDPTADLTALQAPRLVVQDGAAIG
jgi:imidazolonepropionase-like amidohydrolase